MRYYEVVFSGVNLAALTYKSELYIAPFRAVTAKLRGKSLVGFILREVDEPSFNTIFIEEILPAKLNDIQATLAKFIAYYYTCELGVAINLFEPQSLIDDEIYSGVTDFKTPNLSQKQQEALDFINSRKSSLIFGDTGSGKSEIYIAKIREILNAGGQALFLMPEISLTPQMQKRLESFFGEAVAVWHSKITPKKKEQI